MPEASAIESIGRGVLHAPLEPVIGLAEGETRWRGMTSVLSRQRAAIATRWLYPSYELENALSAAPPARLPSPASPACG
jgi:hypothetical protein